MISKHKFSTNIAGLLLAAIPILGIYEYSGIPLMFVFTLLYFFIISPSKTSKMLNSPYKELKIFAIGSTLISLNSLTIGYPGMSHIYSMFFTVINFALYSMLWYDSEFETTRKYLIIGGYICTLFALYQCSALFLGLEHPSGKIEFFEISKSVAGWMVDPYGYRLNSLFSEPSYFAIYMLPLFAMEIINRKIINAIVFASAIVLSSSSLGLIGIAIVVAYEIIYKEGLVKHNVKLILICLAIFFVVIYYAMKDDFIMLLFSRSTDKLMDSTSGSSDIRLVGYIDKFFDYPAKEFLLGVGLSQFENFHKLQGINVYNYSNGFVLTLLNTGLMGGFVLLISLIILLKNSFKTNAFVFLLLFLSVMSADAINFSARFYYLLYFVYAMRYFVYEKRDNSKFRSILV